MIDDFYLTATNKVYMSFICTLHTNYGN